MNPFEQKETVQQIHQYLAEQRQRVTCSDVVRHTGLSLSVINRCLTRYGYPTLSYYIWEVQFQTLLKDIINGDYFTPDYPISYYQIKGPTLDLKISHHFKYTPHQLSVLHRLGSLDHYLKNPVDYPVAFLESIEQRIKTEYRLPNLIAHLAELSGLTQTSLSRLWLRHYGESLADFVEAIRIRKAREYFLKTGDVMSKIPSQIGIKSVKTLNDAHVRLYGFNFREFIKRNSYSPHQFWLNGEYLYLTERHKNLILDVVGQMSVFNPFEVSQRLGWSESKFEEITTNIFGDTGLIDLQQYCKKQNEVRYEKSKGLC